MNPLFSRILMAMAVIMTASLGSLAVAQDAPPAPPAPTGSATPSADTALPPEIDPNSPLAQVIKLAQAGSDISVINAYVANCPSLFSLDADKVIALKDAGVPTAVINGMMAHDQNMTGVAATP